MPELPEVESTRRSLLPLIGGRVIAVDLRRADIVDGPRTPAALLSGASILALHRHGKQLAIEATRAVVLVHLGMTGQLELTHTPSDGHAHDRHAHAIWSLQLATRAPALLWFRDPRRFGGLWTFPSMAEVRARWQRLGPDALTISGEELACAVAGSRRAIKAALLDQAVIAGVGNIYADEALFRAGIRPSRFASRLTLDHSERLVRTIREVLAESIQSGGSTLRDYRDAAGQAGSFQSRHRVYGRGGEPCLVCGARLTQTTIAQRTTVYCRQCQH
ncbi:MAG: bifunctional DNA-formamidopyrimidine glycosylase/DNA-(apurinic or apyrimidinic site) lyase [Phycisphaerales bacterium]